MIPGGEHGNPLQYSCPENPIIRGTWPAIVYRFTKSRIRLMELVMGLLQSTEQITFVYSKEVLKETVTKMSLKG